MNSDPDLLPISCKIGDKIMIFYDLIAGISEIEIETG